MGEKIEKFGGICQLFSLFFPGNDQFFEIELNYSEYLQVLHLFIVIRIVGVHLAPRANLVPLGCKGSNPNNPIYPGQLIIQEMKEGLQPHLVLEKETLKEVQVTIQIVALVVIGYFFFVLRKFT